ncbi:MAG: hypothetical protein K6E54_00810 [Bacteroidaceae bacterium]|nr:hypothetical protein [Bacteroidaceae bacterium]
MKGWFVIIFSFTLLGSCDNNTMTDATLDGFDTSVLKEGDLALRCGYGLESRAVSEASKSSYSHIGIVHHDSILGWCVIHSVPGESQASDGVDRVKYESVDSFYSSKKARNGSIARVRCSDSQMNQVVRYAMQKYYLGTPFDHDYLTRDSVRLYCSELVWRSYSHAGVDIGISCMHMNPLHPSPENGIIFPSDFLKDTLVYEVLTF